MTWTPQGFVDKKGPTILSAWLNGIDQFWGALGAPTNFTQIVTALSSSFQSVISGSFTGTLTGLTTTVTATIKYQIINNAVIVFVPGAFGTSNSPFFTITGAPAAIIPAINAHNVSLSTLAFTNNSATTTVPVDVQVATGIGTWSFALQGNIGGWTNSGQKGISTPINFVYTLD